MRSIFGITDCPDCGIVIFPCFGAIVFSNNFPKINSFTAVVDLRPLSSKLIDPLLRILSRPIHDAATRQIVIVTGKVLPLAAFV